MTADSEGLQELQNFKLLQRHSQGDLVFELLGPSVDKALADCHESHDKLCPETVLQMSTQLLKAVKFIHSAGMCHGGKDIPPFSFLLAFVVWCHYAYFVLDISSRNIAYSCTHMSNTTEEQLLLFLDSRKLSYWSVLMACL